MSSCIGQCLEYSTWPSACDSSGAASLMYMPVSFTKSMSFMWSLTSLKSSSLRDPSESESLLVQSKVAHDNKGTLRGSRGLSKRLPIDYGDHEHITSRTSTQRSSYNRKSSKCPSLLVSFSHGLSNACLSSPISAPLPTLKTAYSTMI
jgi:hypothetical protein